MEAASTLESLFPGRSVRVGDRVQSLWDGYGEIRRLSLDGRPAIAKLVAPPHRDDVSHRRKLRSYEIETAWYAQPAPDRPRMPVFYGASTDGNERIVVLEDLHAAGFQRTLSAHDPRQLDAALLALPAPLAEPAWTVCPLFDEPFFLACPAEHEIAALDAVPEATLAELRLLLLTDGHCLRGQALAACRQSDRGPDDGDFRATSLETLRQLVAAGLGCTLLPALAVSCLAGESGLAVRPLAGGESRRIGLVWRSGHERGSELELLAELLRERLPEAVRAV